MFEYVKKKYSQAVDKSKRALDKTSAHYHRNRHECACCYSEISGYDGEVCQECGWAADIIAERNSNEYKDKSFNTASLKAYKKQYTERKEMGLVPWSRYWGESATDETN